MSRNLLLSAYIVLDHVLSDLNRDFNDGMRTWSVNDAPHSERVARLRRRQTGTETGRSGIG